MRRYLAFDLTQDEARLHGVLGEVALETAAALARRTSGDAENGAWRLAFRLLLTSADQAVTAGREAAYRKALIRIAALAVSMVRSFDESHQSG